MRQLSFLHDSLAIYGGGESVLLHVADLAHGRAKAALGLLWDGGEDELVSQAARRFDPISTFGFPAAAPRPASFLAYRAATRRLHAWLDGQRPSAVVAFALRAALYAAPWARRNRVPLVWVCQQELPLYESRSEAWKQALLLRFLARADVTVVALSEAGHGALAATGIRFRSLLLIRNGIDVESFASASMSEDDKQRWRRQNGIPVGDLTVVCIARLDPIKDHPTLLRSIRLARDRGTRVALACVGGDTSSSFGRHLRDLTRQLAIEDQVRWADHQEDVRPWLGMADLAAMPSLRECASLALIESGACGLAMIGSNVGGIPEIVRHGETGLTFEPANHRALADALVDLANRPARRREMGEAMQALVRSRYDHRHCDAGWRALLDRHLPPDGTG